MSALRFQATGVMGEYAVLDDGRCIGAVQKRETRYNLRRVLVSRGWNARLPNGHVLRRADGYTAATRRDAAEALRLYAVGDLAGLERLVGRIS